MLKKTFHIVLFITVCLYSNAQDPHFSQAYANPLYLGPSFAGAAGGTRITMQYRQQWFSSPGKFVVKGASFDHYFSTFNSGVGANILQDVGGSSQLGFLRAGVHYSYDLKVANIWHIRPGLSFNYIQHGINKRPVFIDDLLHPSDGSAVPPNALESVKDIDAGSSILAYNEEIWLGVSVDHLLAPNLSLNAFESDLELKTSIYGGYDFRKKGKLLKPSDEVLTFAFLYKNQKPTQQLDLGVYWYSHPILLGLWYRGIPLVNSQRGDAIIFVAGFKTEYVNFGYSYDFTISNLLTHVTGSHEITASTKFNMPKRHKKTAVPCPEF